MNTEETPAISADALRFEEEISKLAQQYYEDEGRPEGKANDHWHRAEREVRSRHGLAPDDVSRAPESGTIG